ncbi:MAG: hypothetical protein P8J87_19705, partial [Verrucomicrobiales bacterium]|nr:hypothetical protein [Verrucomicrobiales bacterium]
VNFSRAVVRRRDGEVLLDAVNDVLGTRVEFYGEEKGVRAVQVPGVIAVFGRVKDKDGDGFVKAFGKPPRMLNSDVERVNEASLEQVFALTSGETLEGLLGSDNRLGGWLAGDDVIGEVYWSALGRAPGVDEREGLEGYLGGADDRRKALEDIVWGVLNSKEFLFRN